MAEKEYIERGALLARLDTAFFETDSSGEEHNVFFKYRRIIREQPSADVVAEVHGRWLPRDGDYANVVCSECGGGGAVVGSEASPLSAKERFELFPLLYRFCPVCGARMDGENIALGG